MFIWLFHFIILIIILFGWLLPKWWLKYQMLLVPLVFLDWQDDGQCILTRLEHYFRTGEWEQKTAVEEDGAEFFRPILNYITGLNFSRITASRINYTMFIISWLITYYMFFTRVC